MDWADILNKNTINNIKFSYETINGLDIYKVDDYNFSYSYIFSIGNHYCVYPHDELFILSKVKCFLTKPLLFLLKSWFKVLKLSKVIYINNHGLPTNLYSTNDFNNLDNTVEILKKKYPGYTIIVRGLNNLFNKNLMNKFNKKWFSLLSHNFWYIQNKDYKNNLIYKDIKRDKKLVENLLGNHIIKDNDYFKDKPFSDPIWSNIQRLYSSLYLHKYSVYNPDFNKLWFYETCINGLIEYTGLFDKNNSLKAIIGTNKCENIYSVPVLGYDSNHIYLRAMNTIAMSKLETTNLDYHMGAGLGKYKKNIGALEAKEFQMVYLPKSLKNFFIKNTFKLLNYLKR